MSNPRPCKWCGKPQSEHREWAEGRSFYFPLPRSQPLRAKRGRDYSETLDEDTLGILRDHLEAARDDIRTVAQILGFDI